MRISRLERLTNKMNKESDIARARPSVEKKEWRKDEKTTRKIDTYSLIVEEKATSRSMKNVLLETNRVKLKKIDVKLEVERDAHFIETIIIV